MNKQIVLLRNGRRVMTGSIESDGPLNEVLVKTVAGEEIVEAWEYAGWALSINSGELK